MTKQVYHSGNHLNRIYLIWLYRPSSLVPRLPVGGPALAWIMTHDHAEDMCASERGLLEIYTL